MKDEIIVGFHECMYDARTIFAGRKRFWYERK